jgi:hypothetical protein
MRGEESQDSGAQQDGEPRAKLNLFARDRFFAAKHELIWT